MFSKRILSDIVNFNNTNPPGIYIYPDENNNVIRAMILGHPDTPYKYGFYFFNITFPDDPQKGKYPFVPPIVKFMTSDGITRFNPNLYICGKVCLSILGTWSGPAWSPAGTFMTALLSIQSDVMTSEPLRNEPGYENAPVRDIENYSSFVEHQNFKYALNYQYNNTPDHFMCFKEIMKKHLNENKDNIIKVLENNRHKYNQNEFTSSYSGSTAKNIYPMILDTFKNDIVPTLH